MRQNIVKQCSTRLMANKSFTFRLKETKQICRRGKCVAKVRTSKDPSVKSLHFDIHCCPFKRMQLLSRFSTYPSLEELHFHLRWVANWWLLSFTVSISALVVRQKDHLEIGQQNIRNSLAKWQRIVASQRFCSDPTGEIAENEDVRSIRLSLFTSQPSQAQQSLAKDGGRGIIELWKVASHVCQQTRNTPWWVI